MSTQTTTATTLSNLADEPTLEAMNDDELASVVGGDNPGHGNYGGQCVERYDGKVFCS